MPTPLYAAEAAAASDAVIPMPAPKAEIVEEPKKFPTVDTIAPIEAPTPAKPDVIAS